MVADYCDEHSHWNSKGSLSEWLKQEGIPAISGIDTRAVTKESYVTLTSSTATLNPNYVTHNPNQKRNP